MKSSLTSKKLGSVSCFLPMKIMVKYMKWVQRARKFESAFCLFFVIPKGNKKKISNFKVRQIRVNDKKKKNSFDTTKAYLGACQISLIYGSRCSRMDQVNFWKAAFKNLNDMVC